MLIITEDNSYCYAATEIDYEVGETSIYRDLSLSDLRALDLVNTETWLQHLQELAAGDVHRRRADAESQLRHAQRVLEQLDAIH